MQIYHRICLEKNMPFKNMQVKQYSTVFVTYTVRIPGSVTYQNNRDIIK